MEAITIPLLNPNEPEALLAALHVQEGQAVHEGDPLCSLETTKSTADLHAERDGYIVGLRAREGDTVRAGEILAYLADAPDETAPVAERGAPEPTRSSSGEVPEGMRITQPALALARQHGVDLSGLPHGRMITEALVREYLQAASQPAAGRFPALQPALDGRSLVLYGGGGHAKMLIDLLRSLPGYTIAGILDDGLAAGSAIMDVPVLGGAERLAELSERGLRLAVNAVGGIGNIGVRIQVFERLAAAGFAFPSVVHASAVVERSARLADGAQVFARAYVGSEAQAGFGAIISTGAIISHDCQLAEYSIVSPGAILAGEVHIGAGTLVGMGATINLRVRVGAGARIGNGATVKADVPEKGVVRAGGVWPE